jgi:CelD/BcsL family acetyltransferase involved in cellulose biosynthesis
MPRIFRADFEGEQPEVERTALATEGIDPFCSSPDWMFAAREAWDPDAEPWIWRTEGGYLCFLGERIGLLRVLTPFDRMWGYSCPVLGNGASGILALMAEAGCDLAIVTGLRRGAKNWMALLDALESSCELGVGEPQRRWQASLDGYWERRTRKLRQEVRRIRGRAEERGLRIEEAAGTADGLYRRILAVEHRSWKGPKRTGLMNGEMRRFYAVLLRRLHAHGRLRLRFARLDGNDVGYIAGGVIGDQYRGLQFSFDDRYRDLAPGNLMQAAEIDALIAEGFRVYDLGIDIPYKARWADERVETSTLIIRPRGTGRPSR